MLAFDVAPGRVDVRGRAAPGALVDSELSRTIVEAVLDEVRLTAEDGVASFECTKRAHHGISE
jgi:hypothetical protein